MASIKELLQPEEDGVATRSETGSSVRQESPVVETTHFTIEFVLDTICPHCYIGLRNLQTAIALYQRQHAGATFEITCSPFILNPGAFRSEWSRLGAEVGIDFSWTGRTGNTRDSHKLLRLALEAQPTARRSSEFTRHHGRHPPSPSSSSSSALRGPDVQFRLLEAICQGYFERDGDLSDREWLLEVGRRTTDLPEDEMRRALESEDWTEAVDALFDDVRARGMNSVPVFIIQEHYYVGGWQEPQKFLEVFERVRTSSGLSTA